MRVEKPRFNRLIGGKAYCLDCPWADAEGTPSKHAPCAPNACPTAANYEEQCRLAEQAEKGEKE